jgi:hypothetical protein
MGKNGTHMIGAAVYKSDNMSGSHAGSCSRMIIDCHCHIFTKQVIRNVVSKSELMRELHLDPGAAGKCSVEDLVNSARQSYVGCCILFPTSPPENVASENDRYISMASAQPGLDTCHPAPGNGRYCRRSAESVRAGDHGFQILFILPAL